MVLWAAGVPVRAQQADLRRPAAPHYNVVALRVEFQPDTTRFTTGTGTFDGLLYADGLAPTVDPLPHDAAYFQAHLDFLSDYVAQVSGARTRVTRHLLPEVVRVTQTMEAYSPTGFEADSDDERRKLVGLVEEAWRLASAQSTFDPSGFDPERTVFVLFHAGVGRDVELLGTTLDKTPLDLPSIALNRATLDRLASGPITFKGFPVDNTLILPRTETRQAFDFIQDQPLLLELSINGLLAASFFNALGVPDLFNTETGDPAIGPFGLMDPLGIFAYNGLFPPEPSGWTKYYLGWTDPQELAGDGSLETVLTAAKTSAPPTLARASISSAEYFLIENRHRDPEGDGLVLRIWQDGAVIEQRVQNGQEGFSRFDVSGFAGGVVVGVDNYDWALPGGLDEDDNDLNGGILIWHVDERRFADAFARGVGPNADPERRALDLEEADSAQDLGVPSQNPFAPAADQGTPFDFWFRDNPVVVVNEFDQEIRLYQNRFGPDTFPNSQSNEGGASFIVLDDFSAPGPQMSFTFRREAAAGIEQVLSYSVPEETPFGTGGFISAPIPDTSRLVLYTGAVQPRDALLLLRTETGERTFGLDGPVLPVSVPEERVVILEQSVPGQIALADLGTGNGIVYEDPSGDVTGFRAPLTALPRGDRHAFYAMLDVDTPEQTRVLEFLEEGTVSVVGLPDEPVRALASDGGRVVFVGRRGTQVQGSATHWAYDLAPDAVIGQPAFGRDGSGLVGIVPVVSGEALLFLQSDGSVQRIDLSVYHNVLNGTGALNAFPILADLDNDGRLDVLTTYGEHLVAFSPNGALLAGFPVDLAAPSVAQPLVAELTGSGGWSVIVASTDGYMYAYDLGNEGRPVPGFPLAVGARVEATPLLHANTLYAVSVEGSLKAWTLDTLGAIWWGQLYANAQNQSFVALSLDDSGPQPVPTAGSLIVEAETYNWPNPIRDGQTYLRCMTREDARVQITIIDGAGTLVDEMDLDLRGGTPAEHLWQTDAASGLYYARVTATADDGRTASKLIKMAIVR